MSEALPLIAILGGSGDLGTGLARRWLQAGYRVVIGSRTALKAQTAAEELRELMLARSADELTIESKTVSRIGAQVRGMDNLAAATVADICVLTVPFAHHGSTLTLVREALQAKILIDVTVPLQPPNVARVQLPEQGSAGKIAQQLLGEKVQVVSAFQNVAAQHLQTDHSLDCDVIVCGDKKAARVEVIKLVEAAGMRGVHGGSIANAAAVEAMTSVLIFINKHYACQAGLRITGLDSAGLDSTS